MNSVPAIVLRALAFKEYDRILTLFSPVGILKLFVKGKKKEWLHTAALTSPLTEAEFQYTLGKKELHRFSEGSILKQNLRIRERYESLFAADKMIQALIDTQWPGKPAPRLYQLFSLLLENLPLSKDPFCLSAAFFIKVLRHEGILQLSSDVTACSRYAGERYPSTEAPLGALEFSFEEEALLTELALCRSLPQLTENFAPAEFTHKIERLFSQAFKQ